MNELNEAMRCQFRYHNASPFFFAVQGVFEFYSKKSVVIRVLSV